MRLNKIFFTILLMLMAGFLMPDSMWAQYYKYNKGYSIAKGLSVSLNFGPTIFSGDLGPGIFNKDDNNRQVEKSYVGISYGLGFEKDIIEALSISFKANKGTMQGERVNTTSGITAISFENDFYEFSLGAHINLSNIISGYYLYRPVSFYTITSATLLTFNEISWLHDPLTGKIKEVDLTHIDEHGNAVAFVAKFGGGAKFRLDDKWSVQTEITGNYAFSDRLDGYVHRANKPNQPTEHPDFYYLLQVGVEYQFQSAGFRSQPKFNRKAYQYKYKRFKYNPGVKRLKRR
jgi:hypothetical protein